MLKHYMSMASPDPNYMYVNKSLAYALEMDGGSSVCMSHTAKDITLYLFITNQPKKWNLLNIIDV